LPLLLWRTLHWRRPESGDEAQIWTIEHMSVRALKARCVMLILEVVPARGLEEGTGRERLVRNRQYMRTRVGLTRIWQPICNYNARMSVSLKA
jgi:hypothetical protein